METHRHTMKLLVLLSTLLGLSFALNEGGAKDKSYRKRDPRYRPDVKVFFKEEFDEKWAEKWIHSKHYGDKQGEFELSPGAYYGDPLKDRGLRTTQDGRFYGISTKFKKFTNDNRTLVIQFTVKKEQNIECGGMYLKLYSSDLNQEDLHSETPYLIMFGPDICGIDRKLHVIFNYKGRNLQHKKNLTCRYDNLTHLYTLVVNPERTYEVLVDNKLREVGELEADWDFLPPKKIIQPKPDDWDDREMIEDPWVKKPADFEKPREIPDPDARKPRDWDDEKQGEWKAPMISNPDYEGEWRQPQIKNPNYMGEWVGKEIDNPDYAPDDKLYVYPDIGAVGIDIWQVKGGSVFDNILITDDANYAKVHGIDTWGQRRDPENRMKARLEDEAAWEKYRAEKKKARQAEARRRGIREEDLPDEYADQEYMPEEEEARPHAPGREGLADVRKRAAEREKKEQAKKHERMHDEL
ncbi:calreticulin-like [Babylonia areolata]|uniref:calreticulin-like n=1 Tax=Babylonia areolata TaxID=304850 RepID=UPI003FD3271A